MSLSNEHIKNVLVAASSAIPLVGGPISVILDKYLPKELSNRKDEFINSISKDLEKNIQKTDFSLLESPEYLTSFIKVLQKSIVEHREEKLIAFRNILINEIISESSEFDEVTLYIRLVDDLTVDQIRILHYLYKNELEGHCSQEKSNNIYDALSEKWPGIDKYYLRACFTELLRFFVVTSSTEELKKINKKGHTLTPFGNRFVKYIFAPNKIDH